MSALIFKSSNKNLCFAYLDINVAEVVHRNELSCGSDLSFDLVALVDNMDVAVALDDVDLFKLGVNVFPIKNGVRNFAEEAAVFI